MLLLTYGDLRTLMRDLANGLVSIICSCILLVFESAVPAAPDRAIPAYPLVFIRKDVLVFLGLFVGRRGHWGQGWNVLLGHGRVCGCRAVPVRSVSVLLSI